MAATSFKSRVSRQWSSAIILLQYTETPVTSKLVVGLSTKDSCFYPPVGPVSPYGGFSYNFKGLYFLLTTVDGSL